MRLFKPGKFELGVNYWESKHATAMWQKWDPETIDRDFAVLTEHNMKLVRCFPLWEIFQPIKFLKKPNKNIVEVRFADETPLPDTEAGRAGVDETMMERFEIFCDLAAKHHIELIVCIMTSQMTFRLFTSQAMDGKDLYLDPRALKWEGKYLRYFVNRMKHHSAIRAWESGNESDLLGPVEYKETGAFWMNFVNTIIRQADSTRPVIGINDSSIDYDPDEARWMLADVAEVSDVVSVHPYYLKDINPYDSIHGILYCASANRIQEHIGGCQSFIEETSIRRATTIDADHLGDAIRSILWNSWALGTHAFVWWCAFDQNMMDCAPYDWQYPTLELGIFKADRTPMPGAIAMKNFAAFLKSLPFETLPPLEKDAVCISSDCLSMKVADILSFMNGGNLEFQAPDQKIRDANVYLLPSICGRGKLSTNAWENLKEKIHAGATLYISFNDCFLTDLDEVCGAVITKREQTNDCGHYKFADFELTLPRKIHRAMACRGAEVLARDTEGNPVFFKNQYGKGTVYTAAFELEDIIANHANFYKTDAWKVYSILFAEKKRLLATDKPLVLASDHLFDENHGVSLVRNCTDQVASVNLTLARSWNITGHYSDVEGVRLRGLSLSLPPESGIVITIENNS
jgi:hypothetical protein